MGSSTGPRRVSDHLLQTAVVLDDLRLLYAPVPKAGSTSILWALAEAVGLTPEEFARSRKLEVTRALTVHDGSIWGPSYRLEGRSAKEVEWILGSDEWFRFTVVREPVRRLWSGWVSKVLVRDPRFAAVFEETRPTAVSSARDVLESFRAFVCALPSRDGWHDPHWTSQADLIGAADVTYGHVGRVEQLDRTVAVLGEYVESKGGTLPALRRENPAILPFSPGVFDRRALAACAVWTTKDREAFGYEILSNGAEEPSDAWQAAVEAAIPAIQALIERNERIADLRGMLTGAGEHEPLGAKRAQARGVARRLRRRTIGGP